MIEQLEQMVDSRACFYLGNVDIWIKQGIGKRCPKCGSIDLEDLDEELVPA